MMKSVLQFIKFGVVGISSTVIALCIYYSMLYFGVAYIVANIISWLISVFNTFYWNHRFVFKNNKTWFQSLIKTYVSYGASFVACSILLVIFVEICHISDKIAPLLTLAMSIPVNYIMNKYWTFK